MRRVVFSRCQSKPLKPPVLCLHLTGIAALHGLRWKRLWRHGGADPFSAFPALESSRLGTVP